MGRFDIDARGSVRSCRVGVVADHSTQRASANERRRNSSKPREIYCRSQVQAVPADLQASPSPPAVRRLQLTSLPRPDSESNVSITFPHSVFTAPIYTNSCLFQHFSLFFKEKIHDRGKSVWLEIMDLPPKQSPLARYDYQHPRSNMSTPPYRNGRDAWIFECVMRESSLA